MRILPLLACLLLPVTADALIFRAYLAADGNDANPCTLPQPCRLLPAAINAVASGGEIWMLDSANYNTATVIVNKSVTILAVPGVVGSIVAVSGSAVSVSGSLAVALRNVVIVPLPGPHGHGVQAANGARVSIEDSVLANLNGGGDAVSATTGALVSVLNTTFRGIGGYGISAESGARAQVAGSRFVDSTGGIWAEAAATYTTRVSVTDSVFMQMHLSGVVARSLGGTALVNLTRCTIDTAADIALLSVTDNSEASAATITVNASTIGNNGRNWYKSGTTAAIVTYGNNQFGAHDQANQGSLTGQALE